MSDKTVYKFAFYNNRQQNA